MELTAIWAGIKLYRNVILAAVLAIVLAVIVHKVYEAGYVACEKDHAAADLAATKAALKADEANRSKETTINQEAIDAQSGGENAVKALNKWYQDHPVTKYVPVTHGLPGPGTPGAASGQVPGNPASAGDHQAGPSDDGPPATGDQEAIRAGGNQDCAITTVQALACRQYVEGLSSTLNEEAPQ